MSNTTVWTIAVAGFPLLGYLCGSVPFGFLAGKLKGLDIRRHGSCNVGATNVGRVLGRRWGLGVFALDVLKGLVPVAATGCFLARQSAMTGAALNAAWLLTAFAAIAGHVWPVWLGFKGGKGVATSLGVLLGVYPYFTLPGLVALGVWVAVTLISRYVSLGSVVAAVSFPASLMAISAMHGQPDWALRQIWPLLVFSAIMPLLVIWRHRTNIRRLVAGTENRIGQKGVEPK